MTNYETETEQITSFDHAVTPEHDMSEEPGSRYAIEDGIVAIDGLVATRGWEGGAKDAAGGGHSRT